MNPHEILNSYRLTTKRKKLNGGWEPCDYALFDLYVSKQYIDPALIRIDDVGVYLYLRKNFNPDNPNWHTPSLRQIAKRLDMTFDRLSVMVRRLEKARLIDLHTEHGKRGEYVVYDPIHTAAEFMAVAQARLFGNCTDFSCSSEEKCTNFSSTLEKDCSIFSSSTARENGSVYTYQETKEKEKTKETKIWDSVLESIRDSMPFDTYSRMLAGSRLLRIDNGSATIEVPNSGSIAWLQNRLERNVKKVLGIELHEKIEAVEFVALENNEAERVTLAIAPFP